MIFKIRDPLGFIEQDRQLKARVSFFERVVKPVCLILAAGSILIIFIVILVETIKAH